jgi:uncharacterized protein
MVEFKLNGEFNPKTVLMGFRGIGQVGYLTTKYLIDNLETEKKGVISSLVAHPVVIVEDGHLSYPLEIYQYREIGIIRVEDVPLNRYGAYLIREIIRWLKEKGVERLILVGGLVSTLREGEEDTARVVTNSHWEGETYTRYTQKDVRILGPLAYSLYYSEIYSLPSMAILAYANSEQPVDPRGAYYALEMIKKITGIEMDTEELLKTAAEVEEKIAQLIEEFNENKETKMYT